MAVALRVVVVADDPLARTGLAALLGGDPSLAVIGQVSGRTPADLDAFRPDVALWDLGWDSAPSAERLEEIRESPYPIVTLVADEGQAAAAWAAGAKGILARDSGAQALAASLHAAGQGLGVVAPEFRGVVSQPRLAPAAALREPLTTRERGVLALMAEGLPNKTISQRLAISEHTVKFHVNSIMGKLGAQSRTEAVTLAVRCGLVHL